MPPAPQQADPRLPRPPFYDDSVVVNRLQKSRRPESSAAASKSWATYIRNVDASSATLFELGLYSRLYPYLSTECSTDQALLELPSSKATESYFCLAFTGQNLQALASCLWPLFVGPTYCTCLSFSRRVALSSIGFAAQRARRVPTGRRPSVRPNLLPAMFGTADSLRKQFGAGTAYTQRLPSLVETDLRAAGGADILDRDRLIAPRKPLRAADW